MGTRDSGTYLGHEPLKREGTMGLKVTSPPSLHQACAFLSVISPRLLRFALGLGFDSPSLRQLSKGLQGSHLPCGLALLCLDVYCYSADQHQFAAPGITGI